jgi:ferredoxin-thioredoxin reductase catalytic subunit
MKIKINSDAEIVAKIRVRLKETGGYCPCAIEKTDETKCICQAFMEQKEIGYCTCKLYYKEEV